MPGYRIVTITSFWWKHTVLFLPLAYHWHPGLWPRLFSTNLACKSPSLTKKSLFLQCRKIQTRKDLNFNLCFKLQTMITSARVLLLYHCQIKEKKLLIKPPFYQRSNFSSSMTVRMYIRGKSHTKESSKYIRTSCFIAIQPKRKTVATPACLFYFP